MGSPLRRLNARFWRMKTGKLGDTCDLRVHPDHVVSLSVLSTDAHARRHTCITLVTGEEWVVDASPDTVEALLWPDEVTP